MTLKQTPLALVLIFTILFGVWGLLADKAFAAGSDWDLKSNIRVNDDGVASVQHIFSVQNTDDSATPKEITLLVSGDNVRAVTAKSQDSSRALAAVLNDAGNELTVKLPDNSGVNRKWSFDVKYESDSLTNLGDTDLVYLDALKVGNTKISSHSMAVSLDLGLGFGLVRGPEPTKTQVGIGSQVYNYSSKTGIVGRPTKGAANGLSYYFGESSVAVASIETNLKNDSLWWQKKQIVLPPDTNQQQVLVESIEPQPTNVRLDPDGNVIAEYSLSPKREITVKAQVRIGLNNLTYSIDDKAKRADIEAVLIERYTRATDSWQPGDYELTFTDDSPVAEIVTQSLEAVSSKALEGDAATFSLENRTGSLAQADQLVGLLRSHGVPARVVIGRTLAGPGALLEGLIDSAWAEAYVPGTGWVTLDPSQQSTEVDYATTDILHIGFALWGIEQDFPPVNLSLWDVAYQTGTLPEQAASEPTVEAVKTVLFPGVSLVSLSSTMPSGPITDGVAVKQGEEITEMGSLAPLQKATVRSLAFGGSAFSADSYQGGLLTNGEFVALGSEISSTTNFVPFATVLIGIILLVVGYFVVRRRRQAKDGVRESGKDAFILHEDNTGQDIEHEDLVGEATQAEQPEEPVEDLPISEPPEASETADQIEPEPIEEPAAAVSTNYDAVSSRLLSRLSRPPQARKRVQYSPAKARSHDSQATTRSSRSDTMHAEARAYTDQSAKSLIQG